MFHPKYTSFLVLLNIIYSYCNSLYFNSFLESCVLVTSIIYHYNLIENFRNYDILIVNSVILYTPGKGKSYTELFSLKTKLSFIEKTIKSLLADKGRLDRDILKVTGKPVKEETGYTMLLLIL